MFTLDRRRFLGAAAAGIAGGYLGHAGQTPTATAQAPAGERAEQSAGVDVLLPLDRVPLSFVIDDSTCLVNMGHYCMPQFATAWPDRAEYKKPWKTWPREIPDAFVREFGEWCAEHGVKGKYSIVPYPACVGWVDRELPGWSRRELLESLQLVRELMVPNWDIHPEMITHTRVIDLKTGRPFEEISPATMENSYPQEEKSVDELAAYLAYALRILKNADLPCEGITTPGGFGNRVKPELSLAVHEAVRDVYGCELPHYFKYVVGGQENAEPRLEHVRDLASGRPRVTVNVPAGTGDWYGGWDGDIEPQGHRYATDDARGGRMIELIERRQPAVMLCHWPGIYSHGQKTGLRAFQRAVTAIASRFADDTLWMKMSEMARYWAAKGLTRIERTAAGVNFTAPFAAPRFTFRVAGRTTAAPQWVVEGERRPLAEIRDRRRLSPGVWLREEASLVVCVDLPQGASQLLLG